MSAPLAHRPNGGRAIPALGSLGRAVPAIAVGALWRTESFRRRNALPVLTVNHEVDLL
jgi:hypothetical protein